MLVPLILLCYHWRESSVTSQKSQKPAQALRPSIPAEPSAVVVRSGGQDPERKQDQVHRAGSQPSGKILKRLDQADLPPDTKAFYTKAARLAIELMDARFKMAARPNAVNSYFKAAGNKSGPEVDKYNKFGTVIEIVAVAELLQDPTYQKFLDEIPDARLWQGGLHYEVGRTSALLGENVVPNLHSLTAREAAGHLQALAAQVERSKGELGIPEVFLEEDFLTWTASNYMETMCRRVLATLGEEFKDLIDSSYFVD